MTEANQVPQQIWAAQPPMPFQAGQSSLFLPGFASCLGASSTQQPAAVATAQAPQGGIGRVFQRALPNGGADSGIAMAPNAFGDVATTFVVCKFKKMPSHDSEIRQGLQMCSNPKCNKAAHYECYKKEVLAKHNVRPVIFPHTEIEGSPSGEAVVCSKQWCSNHLAHSNLKLTYQQHDWTSCTIRHERGITLTRALCTALQQWHQCGLVFHPPTRLHLSVDGPSDASPMPSHTRKELLFAWTYEPCLTQQEM